MYIDVMQKKYFIEVKPVIDYGMRKLCLKPYRLHPAGCPNFNKRCDCPPFAKLFDKCIDLNKTIYAVYNIFDFKAHVDKMKRNHPDWTIYQLRCCLYWQPKARKQLKEKIKMFREKFSDYSIVKNPEAMGVNLTETMKNSGIKLEWPPENVTYQIVLAGRKIKNV